MSPSSEVEASEGDFEEMKLRDLWWFCI